MYVSRVMRISFARLEFLANGSYHQFIDKADVDPECQAGTAHITMLTCNCHEIALQCDTHEDSYLKTLLNLHIRTNKNTENHGHPTREMFYLRS